MNDIRHIPKKHLSNPMFEEKPAVLRRAIVTIMVLIGLLGGLCTVSPAGGRRSSERPDLPWAKYERASYRPGMPGRDYTPVFTPNGSTLAYKVVNGVKVFHLISEPIEHEVAKGLIVRCWGFNGATPGPTIELLQGDRVRIYVTNRLPAETTVHWHGIILPGGMDGVAGLTQPAIPPGQTFVYEFIFPHHGTFMYHPHFDGMTQEGMGMTGMIVVHPRDKGVQRPDRDFALMLHEWKIVPGTSRPNTLEMTDFNILTINGKAFPDTHPLVAEIGDRVRIRIGNLSAMDHHPIHLHGYAFKVVATDGGPIPKSAQWPETTVLVHVGSTRTIEFLADNPGDWLMHCHMTHHTMNQMGHDLPNMVGVDPSGLNQKIKRLLPGYMTMGTRGMRPLQEMHMPVPPNSIPMLGFKGQFGQTVLGSMVTVLKVRKNAPSYEDPGPYRFPKGSVSRRATEDQMRSDGIRVGAMKEGPHPKSRTGHHE
jgi:FtsP/CotA-like multicopper oxidase with cupredoxin domain